MSIIDPKYDELTLTNPHLRDPILMALAWKKSHHYIRTINWYANNFELDISSLDIIKNSNIWIEKVKNGDAFTPLELVPAPKSCAWEFQPTIESNNSNKITKPNWNPIEEQKLRALAHIPIGEQTIMTLLMMCMANNIESLQGDPESNYELVHERQISSYGNRLYCNYKNGRAYHSYGATTTYSKYFSDYKKFLGRPQYFANKALGEIAPNEDVFIIELDISKFFDKINKKELIKKIKDYSGIERKTNQYNLLNNILKAFENWEWSKKSIEELPVCGYKKNEPPNGIPQGLVSAGFLANIYLIEFDKLIRKKIGINISNNIKLIDYCRYVDDIRLVIITQSEITDDKDITKNIKVLLENLIEKPLKEINLELNTEKTKISNFRGASVGISKKLNHIQSKLSGPQTLEIINEQLGQLDALLNQTNDLLDENTEQDWGENTLANIGRVQLDVRNDTLQRFAANKICQNLKEKRQLITQEVNTSGQIIPSDWDYEQEYMARRFITFWSKDPSLILLLKKGLELFPCTKLINPILSQLEYTINNGVEDSHKAVAIYCLAEIFRHSAIVIHQRLRTSFPIHAEVESYFEVIQYTAAKYISIIKQNNENSFNLLEEQARFLLLVRLDTTLESSSNDPRYDLIFKICMGFRNIKIPAELSIDEITSCILLAQNITDISEKNLRSVSHLLNSLDANEEDISIIFNKIIEQNFEFSKELLKYSKSLQMPWVTKKDIKQLIDNYLLDIKPLETELCKITGEQSLYRIILRNDNPFSNEIMALKLMESLLKNKDILKVQHNLIINLAETKVNFSKYSNPPSYEDFNKSLIVNIKWTRLTEKTLPNYLVKSPTNDTTILQKVAMCIRSVIYGNQDWTILSNNKNQSLGYKGIKTTPQKRQLGLITFPELINGKGTEVSSWLSKLLSTLLIWPGIFSDEYSSNNNFTIDLVLEKIKERLLSLKSNYCKQSAMPSLIEKVNLNWPENKKSLNIAMVQSKLPFKSDFISNGILLDNPIYRVKHRRHVANMADLIIKQIKAQNLCTDSIHENEVDLIIWPELAVHQDDIDILIHLSRKTNAIIFSGLTFLEQNNIDGPNNCAIWIIPSLSKTGQKEILRLQGKKNMMKDEVKKIKPWRPYQFMLELTHPLFPSKKGFIITGSICYDATDISLSSDLRSKSDTYIISALNQDINTFDSMVEALHYHMYQPVILVNSGEFGGSYAKAPYKEPYHRLIAHNHGNNQVSINTFEINMFDFRKDNIGSGLKSGLKTKSKPAGL